MSMGDGNLSDDGDSLDEQPSLVQPKAGEKIEVGMASYNEEEFYSKSGSAFGQDPFRLEDSKQAWDASLDADVQATAELLAEQMRANPETAVDVTEESRGEELGEFADPLGLGVLNQSTMTLESAESAKAGNNRRQLKKMARWQAETTMRLGKADSDQPQACRFSLLCCCYACSVPGAQKCCVSGRSGQNLPARGWLVIVQYEGMGTAN